MNNPMQMIKMMMGKGNPKEMVMNMIKNNSNPMLGNLIDMANKGDTSGLENFAKNYMKEQGRDYDTEFKDFMNNFK